MNRGNGTGFDQVTTRGRIMSCSSCSRMWQCHTYSCPPVLGLMALRIAAVGRIGRSNLHDHRGHFSRVHPDRFLPADLVRIGRHGCPGTNVMPLVGSPLNACRWMIWTLTRWKWMGWVSPVRLKICQTSVAPAAGFSVAAECTAAPTWAIPGYSGSFWLNGSDRLDQAAELVEVLVQGQHAVRTPAEREGRYRRVAVVEEQVPADSR